MLLRLVIGNLIARRARTLLTAMSIAVAVALVVGMTSGFKAFETAAGGFLDQFMGAVDANIYRTINPAKALDQSLLTEFENDPQVRLAFPRLNTDAPLVHNTFGNPLTAKASMVGVNKQIDPLLGFMKMNRGRWFEPGEQACVIDEGLFKTRYGKGSDELPLPAGDKLQIKGQYGALELPIVGVVHKPGIFAGFMQTVYVPIESAQKYAFGPDSPPKMSEIRVQVEPGTNLDEFNTRWTNRLAEMDPGLKIKLTRTAREGLDKNFLGMRLLSSLGGAVAMLSAMFIIFSTLSMGVAERQRTLAMMRAIGMTRRQVAMMVLIEGVLISFIGVVIGVPLGYGFSAIVVQMMKPMFELAPALDWLGVAIAGGGALGAAIIAGQLPAWQATRVDPLEAMNPLGKVSDDAFPWRTTIIGALMIALDPLLLYFPVDTDFARGVKFYTHFVVGLPALLIGFFLVAPALIWLITHLLGPVLCVIFRVPFSIVSQQISGGRWRSAGTCASLMVGLGVLIVMETQGNSSLKSWQLPNNFPDVFIFTRSLSGLTPPAQAKISASPLLRTDDVMPIGAFSPEVGPGILGLMGTQLPGNTMFVAVDPDKVFRMMELDFREGNPQDAARMLKLGRHVIVTQEYKKLRNLGVGDILPIKSATKGMLNYTIAGVVWSPGIDVMVNSFDLSQQFEQQSQACVFGSLEDARNDFGVENVYLMAANFRELGVPKTKLMTDLQTDLADTGINVADVRQLKASIEKGLQRLLLVASSVAWGALLVASLGVTNTIVASIRSRTWQFGVLRSVGLTRGTLLRIVLIEAVLLGVIGAALGLGSGAVMTLDARELMRMAIGHEPPISIPGNIISLGVLVVVGVSLMAAILPAIRVARTEPLTLLQAGRTAA